MQVTFETGDPAKATADALVVPVGSEGDVPMWSPLAKALDEALSGELSSLAADARFSGKTATTLLVPTLGRVPSRRIILAGLGQTDRIGEATVARMAGAAVRAGRDAGARHIAVALPDAGFGIDPHCRSRGGRDRGFTCPLSLRRLPRRGVPRFGKRARC